MIKTLSFFILLLFFGELAQAQNIRFNIKDFKDKGALPAVSFTISKDTTFRKVLLTDQNGRINIPDLPAGRYRIQTSYVGYSVTDTTFNIRDQEEITLFLREEAISLKGVAIRAQKKFIENKNGNFIMNIQENTLAKTSNTWEALKFGPLVEAGMDGSLKISNKAATVFIDGRQLFLSGDELMKYLENIPSANIEKVEISAHPGAKYDSNIGAVILITTTNMRYEGVKGTLSLANTNGVYSRYNGGLTIDAKKGKLTSQAGYTYGRSKTENVSVLSTAVNSKNLPWQVDQTGLNRSDRHRIFGNLGVDFDRNNQLTLYAEYAPNNTDNFFNGNNGAYTAERKQLQDSVWQSSNAVNGSSKIFSSQAQYEIKWDSTRHSVKFIAAYSKNKNNSTIINDFANYNSESILQPKTPYYKAVLPGNTEFVTLSGQYVHPFLKGEWISGARYYNTTLENENLALNYTDAERTLNEMISNRINFRYNEVNYGLFTSWEAQLKSWYFQLGLRAEQNQVFSQTNGSGKEKIYDKLSPFPSLYIQKKINDRNALDINYSKQISRPDYSLLNPFSRFTDNTVANFVGNSDIKPAINHNINVSYTYNNKLVFNFGAVIFKDLISSVLAQNDQGLLQQQYDNFNGAYYYLGGYYSLNPLSFWQLRINGRLLTIDLKPYRDLPLSSSNINVYGNINNDFTFAKNWKIGIGFNGSNVNSDQLYHHLGYSNMSASLVKEFKKPQLILYIRGNDIFKGTYEGEKALFLPYSSRAYNDTRTIAFGLTYRFGKQTVKAKELTKDDNLQEANQRIK
ncbi:Outer membrane receptor proteins, mostly Fe transport [Pedobacter westerhofensis]|uniref:Outer membrane receptor proteins, mostly Fe transport n=1 Tax=Pedobacter westerhofensis TaxID=425512 RepID=A0A521B4I7_9SPHI|nr:outer membrane beta-barrel family protein [Pedobacter westerhofensis]SMO42028.1 Outer membrane receptor proteins, mostly Fe transport [Pedobacter westerhofensis]